MNRMILYLFAHGRNKGLSKSSWLRQNAWKRENGHFVQIAFKRIECREESKYDFKYSERCFFKGL